MKIQMSLNEELVKRADNYCKQNYLSRSALVSISLNQYLNTNECVIAIKEMVKIMSKVAEQGTLDEQSKQDLAVYERMLNAYSGVVSAR